MSIFNFSGAWSVAPNKKIFFPFLRLVTLYLLLIVPSSDEEPLTINLETDLHRQILRVHHLYYSYSGLQLLDLELHCCPSSPLSFLSLHSYPNTAAPSCRSRTLDSPSRIFHPQPHSSKLHSHHLDTDSSVIKGTRSASALTPRTFS